MKRILAAACVLALLLLLTCSKKPTAPTTEPPIQHIPFSISYTADPGRASSARITAATGGSITATDKDSVSFQLTIPPHALKSDTLITITPLSSLHIGGPSGDRCLGCTETDSLCCYRGALFEPNGLVLDSAATLAVQLPKQMGFPYPHGGLIVYLDSVRKSCQACLTIDDTTAGRLQAQITHFSGYGTDDEKYNELEEEIYAARNKLVSDIGSNSFYYDLSPLKQLHDVCRIPTTVMGETIVYPDLAASIETIVLNAYTKQAAAVESQSTRATPCDGIHLLDVCIMNLADFVSTSDRFGCGWSNHDAFSFIKSTLGSDLVVLVTKTAQNGHALCLADSCHTGQELLGCAYSEIRRSFFTDIPFDTTLIDSTVSWLIHCCRLKVTIAADKSVACDMVVDKDSTATVVTFKVEASEEVGPMVEENFTVDCRQPGSETPLFYLGGQTNDSGIGYCKYAWCYPGDCPNFVPKGSYEFRAHVQFDGNDVGSDPVTVTLEPVGISMDYHYTAVTDYTGSYSIVKHDDISMTGRGVIFQGDAKTCGGQYWMTRTESFTSNEGGGITCTLIDDIKVPACFFWFDTDFTELPDGTPICFLKGARVLYGAGIAFGKSVCTDQTGSDTVNSGNPNWPGDYLPYWTCDATEYCVPIPFDGSNFPSISWDTLANDYYGRHDVHLTIQMGVQK